MAKTLQEIIKRRSAVTGEREARSKDHMEFLTASAAELKALAEAEAMIIGGLDISLVEIGSGVIDVFGRVSDVRLSDEKRNGEVRGEALDAAKRDIAHGAQKLCSRYIGVKNYDRFGDQREDHEYGMGPRHGSIVFSIGLRRDVLKRLRDGGKLTAEEINAALYVLSALPQIEKAKQQAA